MRVISDLLKRKDNNSPALLLNRIEEECHRDAIERRAKTLWTSPLSDSQDLVVVRKATDNRVVFHRVIGSMTRRA